MDEKITTPVEEVAEPQQTLDETPAEQTALLEKLDAVQQALATLQQSFDDNKSNCSNTKRNNNNCRCF